MSREYSPLRRAAKASPWSPVSTEPGHKLWPTDYVNTGCWGVCYG